MSDKSNDACVVCPYWLARRKDIHPIAKLVYGRLFVVAADRDFEWFFPNLAAVGQSIGLTKVQVVYYLKYLHRLELIDCSRRAHPDGRIIWAAHVNPSHPWVAEAPDEGIPSPVLFEVAEEVRRIEEEARRPRLRLVP